MIRSPRKHPPEAEYAQIIGPIPGVRLFAHKKMDKQAFPGLLKRLMSSWARSSDLAKRRQAAEIGDKQPGQAPRSTEDVGEYESGSSWKTGYRGVCTKSP